MYIKNEDTICAPATVPGTGAISVIRVSGPDALTIADKGRFIFYIALLIIATSVFLDKVNHRLKARIGNFHMRIPLDLRVVTFP